MTFSLCRCFGTLALAMAAATSAAHEGPLDPSFGDGGMRAYGFQAIDGGNSDQAIVGCATANGTFTVMGSASSERRIVTMRLLKDGSIDTGFSADGKESFVLPGTYTHFAPGLCQPDGHMVAARSITAPDGEQHLQIFRVLKHTGQLDEGFGNAGVVTIDLDQWIPGLDKEEMPLGVNVLANGDLAVSGRVALRTDEERGFVVLLGADGSVRRVAAVANLRSRTATTVVDAPDGRLWVFGQNGRIPGAYRATLNRTTLAWEAVLEYRAPANQWAFVGNGRVVDAQTVVLAAGATPMGTWNTWPQLIVFRAASVSAISLPLPVLDEKVLYVDATFGGQGVTVLPGRRVLFAATAEDVSINTELGVHFAMAQIGDDAGGDRIDPSFGIAGAQTAAFRPRSPACASEPPLHYYGRLTLWLDRPSFVGSVYADCDGNGSGSDYLVMRLRSGSDVVQ
ncbi:MAG TPA: hypothetical protein VLF18_02225 [Tahibacter sp.]|uniref:hypothetical protein n=1 Tax=Tahibacter sp. TaxID=2056211 RepID=UPI002C8CE76C|nr:hypothetical protein [Tahibacter sp.]HSX58993.1 hypothetical protein [Tahibacter sp.]